MRCISMEHVSETIFQAAMSFIVILGVRTFLEDVEPNNCEMTYMFEYPRYVEVALPREVVERHPKYRLFVYCEGAYCSQLHKPTFDGIPVLFIPGNAGSYKQARSIGSVLLSKARSMNSNYHFNVFTVDLNEELSALYGGVLMEQTDFVRSCVEVILSKYSSERRVSQKSVLLLGHSMGGVVARALFILPDFDAAWVHLIVTLASPHTQPVIQADHLLADFYRDVNTHWSLHHNTSLSHVHVLSVGGGHRDNQVSTNLADLTNVVGTGTSLSTTSTEVPRVWSSTDHACIVWCLQLVLATARLFFATVRQGPDGGHRVTTNDTVIMRALLQHFDGRPRGLDDGGGHLDSAKKIKFRRELAWDTYASTEWISKPESRAKYIILPLPINFDSLIVWTTAERNPQWLWASNNCSELLCDTGWSLAHLVETIPGDPGVKMATRQVARVSLVALFESEATHIVLLQSKGARVGGEWFHSDEREVLLPAAPITPWTAVTSLLEPGAGAVSLTTSPQATYYCLRVGPGVARRWQAFSAQVESVRCSDNVTQSAQVMPAGSHHLVTHSVARLHSPAFREDLFRWVGPGGEPTNISVAVFSPPAGVRLLLYLTPACQYRVTVTPSVPTSLSQLFRHYAVLVPSYVVVVLVVGFGTQTSAYSKTGQCPPLHTTLFRVTLVLSPSIALTSLLTEALGKEVPGVVDEVEMFPAVLMFLAASTALTLAARALALLIFCTASALSAVFRRCVLPPDLEHHPWVQYSVVITCALLGTRTCGALSLLLGLAWYLVRLVLWHSSPDQAQQNLYQFHTGPALLWAFVAGVNVPTFIVWIKNIGFSLSLYPDPSFPHALILLLSMLFFTRPAPEQAYRTFSATVLMTATMFLAGVFVLLFGTISMYRLPYVISTTLLIVSFTHFYLSVSSTHAREDETESVIRKPKTEPARMDKEKNQ